ncbi:RNB domain-containing ribonuclease [Tsukamurella soli]|uniref:RNB domain-containing ribonuclease n=1 Tax=Tsukamurella soli TaxID=644556 RepID=A0ABP8JQP3_9ACTN
MCDVDFQAVRDEFALTEVFGPAEQREADTAADRFAIGRRDRADLPLVTIDPPGSCDLDQAMYIAADSAGYTVYYAIADVAALVTPGGALDLETRRRGQTYYLPDGSVPLHPLSLSEGAGSLLPQQDRPAALWEIRLDRAGEVVSARVDRARVRSVARLDYHGVQADWESGRLHPSVEALADVGRLRAAWGRAHGSVDLRLPEQEAVRGDDGWELRIEPRTAFDEWNAQISLLTGMCAAQLMLRAGVGVLRTLPPADAKTVTALRRSAAALGFDWPESTSVGEFLDGVDVSTPRGLAVMADAVSLLRGAGYAPFDGAVPEQPLHAGVGAPYAHVTAPLRRLGDRFATEVCLAVSASAPVPDWVRSSLVQIAETMHATDSLSAKVGRACIDLTEATILAGRVGERFAATVMRGDQVFVEQPAVIAKCAGDPPEGRAITVRLARADVAARKVAFDYQPDMSPAGVKAQDAENV